MSTSLMNKQIPIDIDRDSLSSAEFEIVIESLALALIDEHIPKHISGYGWVFEWNNRLGSLGVCRYNIRPYGMGIIGLSRKWVHKLPLVEIVDTILHEIAHAIAGHEAGHGMAWKNAAILVGANPITAYTGDITKSAIEYHKYEMVDTTTGDVIKKYWKRPAQRVWDNIGTYYRISNEEATRGKIILREVQLLELL